MFIGLPSWWNTVLFYAVILIPVTLFWPVIADKVSFPRRRESRERSHLSLWHRCLCVLLAYVFFVTPEGILHLSQAAIQYGQLSTASWGQGDTTIVYEYDDNGSMTKKTTKTTSTQIIREVVDYGYNLQGKLKEVRTNKQAGTVEVAQYAYTPSGDRYRATTWTEVSGTPGSYQTKLFVVDIANPTGYSQVLEEWTYNTQNPIYGTTTPTSVKYYTLGDDVISQAIGSDTSAGTAQYLLYDGHGSTRQLLNHAYNMDGNGKPITSDSYSYDGYGVMLGDTANAENNAQTNLLYCGEQYDKALSQYYLRARYYNPLNGLFNQMDPHAGSMTDPQSLHKYLYCHANPVNRIDPSGKYSLGEMLVVSTIIASITAVFATSLNLIVLKKSVSESLQEGLRWFWISFAIVAAVYSAIWMVHSIWIWLYGGGQALSNPEVQTRLHHFASNKNSYWTPLFEKIVNRYGLKLNDAWNLNPFSTQYHNSLHPWEYHEWVYSQMIRAANEAGQSTNQFILLFQEYVVIPVMENPEMLKAAYWRQGG